MHKERSVFCVEQSKDKMNCFTKSKSETPGCPEKAVAGSKPLKASFVWWDVTSPSVVSPSVPRAAMRKVSGVWPQHLQDGASAPPPGS